MNQQAIHYFDNNATTRVAPEVVHSMLPFLHEQWGNPSSAYSFGRDLARHIEEAREKVAGLINADPREIIFTSCGSESINSAIHSALVTHPQKRRVVRFGIPSLSPRRHRRAQGKEVQHEISSARNYAYVKRWK